MSLLSDAPDPGKVYFAWDFAWDFAWEELNDCAG
jgi:hypothetical protein